MKRMLEKQVEKAFRALKGLAVDVTILSEVAGAFDFGTQQAVSSTASVTTQGVLTQAVKKIASEPSQKITHSLIVKATTELPKGAMTVIAGSTSYKVVGMPSSNGFTTKLDLMEVTA